MNTVYMIWEVIILTAEMYSALPEVTRRAAEKYIKHGQ